MRRNIVVLLAPLVVLAGCSRASGEANAQAAASAGPVELRSLTIDEVEARIAAHDGKTFIYDNNSKERYAEGHVPTARWVSFKNVTAADLPPDKGATLVFYCAGRS